MTTRFVRALDALSQLGNVMIFNGDPNYSISGESYRKGRKKTQAFIDWVFSPFEDDHCYNAYLNDLNKAATLVTERQSYDTNQI